MKKILLICIAFALLCSHDMFLKMDNYFLESQTDSVIQLFNGTFEESENVIDRNRMLDASLVGNGNRIAIDTTQWFEKDSITFLNFKTGNAGTWVAGVSTAPRDIELDAKSFNEYLEHDGVLDMLEWRKKNNALYEDAVEKYSKHVKTIFQVGDTLSNDWKVNLGYPIEFIPLENPYAIHPGHNLKVKLLRNGKPLANQLVYLGNNEKEVKEEIEHTHANGETHSHSHNEEENHTHQSVGQLRTDSEGVVDFEITSQGVWYLRTIYMERLDDEKLTHESNWATLTFAVGDGSVAHSHDETADTHGHEQGEDTHEHDDEGFPSYIFWIGSFIVVAILFFLFNRKKS